MLNITQCKDDNLSALLDTALKQVAHPHYRSEWQNYTEPHAGLENNNKQTKLHSALPHCFQDKKQQHPYWLPSSSAVHKYTGGWEGRWVGLHGCTPWTNVKNAGPKKTGLGRGHSLRSTHMRQVVSLPYCFIHSFSVEVAVPYLPKVWRKKVVIIGHADAVLEGSATSPVNHNPIHSWNIDTQFVLKEPMWPLVLVCSCPHS